MATVDLRYTIAGSSKEPQIAALLVATTALQPTPAINQTHIHVLEFGRGG
jgi:hypothetical protein